MTTDALLLGGVHLLVDAASLFVIFFDVSRGAGDAGSILTLVVLYNSLAFGGQIPAGLVADRWRCYPAMGVVGAVAVSAGLLLAAASPLVGVVGE